MSASPPPRKAPNPHLQGLLGVLLGLLAIAIVLGLLRLRRDHTPVDPAELSLSTTSSCMAQAIQQASEGGHVITYGELDALKRRCGS
ncbi:MAG: hypothetical protein KGJ64_06650 [Betaproteobacteria bacterium]|nr:hypothetical protein [Betaproteobacteria bacterium]